MNNQNKKLFEELKKVSVNLGKNVDLIQANGGNKSIKINNIGYEQNSLIPVNNNSYFYLIKVKKLINFFNYFYK